MTVYDVAKVQVAWRNHTLEGFGSQKIHIAQDERTPSMLMHIGIFGEYFSFPNVQRGWIISSEFLLTGSSYKMLMQDNLFHRQGSLIIRDLNSDSEKVDIFHDCCISSIGFEKDGKLGKVKWYSPRRNFM